MKNMKKILVLSLAALLLVAVSIGGTVAYLKAESDEVENVFTTSDITISLDESDDLDLKMVPGGTIEKDPVVTVEAGSEKCWLFVEVTRSANFDSYMTYAMNSGWVEIASDGYTKVYGYTTIVDASDAAEEIKVLANDEVSVKAEVTKAMMETAESNKPTLTFKAYAVQSDNISATTVNEAWVVYNAAN